MQRFLEKKVRKYVIATLDRPTQYLVVPPAPQKYYFVEDIERASKTLTRKLANEVHQLYYNDSGLNQIHTVVVPIEETYEIIMEDNYEDA